MCRSQIRLSCPGLDRDPEKCLVNFRELSSHHGLLQLLQGGRGSTGQGTQGPVFLSELPLSGLVILGKSLLGSEPVSFYCGANFASLMGENKSD